MNQVSAFFEEHPGVSALFGSYDDEPYETNFLSQYKNLMHHYMHRTGHEEASTFWAGCGAMRREVFLAIGGFDAHKYATPCIEDIELGYRLKKSGYRIRVLKALQAKHLKRWTPFSLLKADIFHRALPWTTLILEDKQFINDSECRYLQPNQRGPGGAVAALDPDRYPVVCCLLACALLCRWFVVAQSGCVSFFLAQTGAVVSVESHSLALTLFFL
ncbi:MAG: hypothetical protein GY801_21430 [bacterium]|nr:hypothetical protein [bacterium]